MTLMTTNDPTRTIVEFLDRFTSAPASIAAVTLEQVGAAAGAMLPASNRTVGWFEPLEV